MLRQAQRPARCWCGSWVLVQSGGEELGKTQVVGVSEHEYLWDESQWKYAQP